MFLQNVGYWFWAVLWHRSEKLVRRDIGTGAIALTTRVGGHPWFSDVSLARECLGPCDFVYRTWDHCFLDSALADESEALVR